MDPTHKKSTTKNGHSVSVVLGQPCQYKSEHHGKVVFSWHEPEDKLATSFGYDNITNYVGEIHHVPKPFKNSPVNFTSASPSVPLMPAPAYPSGTSPQKILYTTWTFTIATDTYYDVVNNSPKTPWSFKMPWGLLTLPGFENVGALSPYQDPIKTAANRIKVVLTPIGSVTLNAKTKEGIVIKSMAITYLKCLVSNPEAEGIATPKTIWVKQEWIEPHTGEENYEKDLRSRFLQKLRAGTIPRKGSAV